MRSYQLLTLFHGFLTRYIKYIHFMYTRRKRILTPTLTVTFESKILSFIWRFLADFSSGTRKEN